MSWPPAAGVGGLRGALVIAGGLLLVAAIAFVDYATGPHLSCSLFYLIPVAACAWWGGFPHGILLALAGAVSWHLIDRVEIPDIPSAVGAWNGIVRFGTLALVSSLVSRLRIGILRERWLACTDPLTGAANARTFYEAVVREAERARRARRPLTLAYFDVDDFKQINDRLGHAVGDEILSHLVETIRQTLRCSDLLARLGGDEFALLLPEQGAEGAPPALTRMRQRVSEEMARRGWPVTVSVGAVTFLRPAWDVDLMIRRVDALMYGAKRNGKGRVEHAVEQDGPPRRTEGRQELERRATTRVLCDRTVRVRGEGEEEAADALAKIYDISAEGMGLCLGKLFPEGTLLVIEPLSPRARTLLARVVRVTPQGAEWLHGCVLPAPLNAEDLGGWLGVGSDGRHSPPVSPSLPYVDNPSHPAEC